MKLLICDQDQDYVKALVTYLINCKNGYEPSSYSDEGIFAEAMHEEDFLKQYDCMLLASPFYELVTDAMDGKKENPKRPDIYRLVEEQENNGKKSFYKYQSAEALKRLITDGKPECIAQKRSRDSPIISLVSPMHHELLLPYALVLANIYADQGSVLLVDLEQISFLPGFCGHDFRKNIMDLAYMLESSREDEKTDRSEICIDEYIEYIGGIAVLAAPGPMEINTLTSEQWEGVINLLKAQKFDRVILLFDELHQGFDAAARASAEVIMLCRHGAYFARITETFIQMYERGYSDVPLRQAYLQMNAADLPNGNFMLEELLDGKLNGIIRKQLAIGT